MRKIVFGDKHAEVDSLRKKDIKTLRSAGFAVSTVSIGGITGEQWDDFIEAIINIYLPGQSDELITAMDEMPKEQRRELELELIAETWGAEKEEKN